MSEEQEGQNFSIERKIPLEIKEKAPQSPEVPWNQWLSKLNDRFKYWLEREKGSEGVWPPKLLNLPEQYYAVRYEIPDEYSPDIVNVDEQMRLLMGNNSDKIFYRPGIGFGGALHAILGKIGTYHTLVVSDPVYEGKEMVSWSEGLLPVDYYIKSLQLIDAENIRVTLTDNYLQPGIELPSDEYRVSEILSGGMATINFRINGVDLTIHLLAEDMTKFNPSSFDILSLGRPTPYNPDKASDPRGNDEFREQIIENLKENGIIEYHEGNFSFLPHILPSQVYGFEMSFTDGDKKIIRKIRNVSTDKIKLADQAVRDIQEAIGALAGEMPGRWLGYYKNIERYSENGEKVTLDDVTDSFTQQLNAINAFVSSIDDAELKKAVFKRIEFLLMNPVATNGKLDKKKIIKIHKVSEDPDKPEKWKKDSGKRPYFGNPYELIADHNAGDIDIFEYYNKLINSFYTTFSNTA